MRFTEKLEWIFDYYIAYLLYNPRNIDRYHKYLTERWDFELEDFDESGKNEFDKLRRISPVRNIRQDSINIGLDDPQYLSSSLDKQASPGRETSDEGAVDSLDKYGTSSISNKTLLLRRWF